MWCISLWMLMVASLSKACEPTVTTVSGSHAPSKYCSGDMIFQEDFEELDLEKWQHENTLSGGGNWEFQYYSNNRTNSFVHDGLLFIRPSLTADHYGDWFISAGRLNVDGGAPADRCTNSRWFGCERIGTANHILNPIKSARLRSISSFSFRYGRIEVRAKMPAGDWLWPAVWLMPTYDAYGTWPASGEIDLVESRGNRHMYLDGVHIGTQEAGSKLHYGPYPELNGWDKTHWIRRNTNGYDRAFHRYEMEWTPDYMKFTLDDEELGTITPDEGGFWKIGEFGKTPNVDNPWKYATKMAPFDQKFYIILNLAVGGINGYFPDGITNPDPKPWFNYSPAAATDFWKHKSRWLPTWNLDVNDGQDASLQVDYVRVWAL
ncbi:beta-1,3-glucan-binding protein-like [Epargyreus clarus]|uniref:beta-1,3-glucan-binding protein-like n=1 Tax=Epargyreus clarus TaxID=520877 RepID=UPI003C2E8787